MRLFPSSVQPWFLTLMLGALGVTSVCVSAPAVAQAPPPTQPASAAPAAPPADPPVIRPYALIKPTIVFAGSPVESFSQPNASAVTAAGNPVLSSFAGTPAGSLNEEAALTFQV